MINGVSVGAGTVSMGQRARGYQYETVKIFMPQGSQDEDGNPKPVYAPYMEHVPADVNAGFRWLYNRQPEKWRDRRNVDQTGSIDVRLAVMTPEERARDAIELVERVRARLAAHRTIEQEPEE
jgi:hypothetical protein